MLIGILNVNGRRQVKVEIENPMDGWMDDGAAIFLKKIGEGYEPTYGYVLIKTLSPRKILSKHSSYLDSISVKIFRFECGQSYARLIIFDTSRVFHQLLATKSRRRPTSHFQPVTDNRRPRPSPSPDHYQLR
jgi:hypothetical protein